MSTLPTGLTQDEVLRRRAAGQGNNVKIKTSRSYWEIFQENLISFINIVFFSLSAIMIALRRYSDAILVAVVILSGVVIGIVQEIWAKRKLDEIALLQRPTASVIREGKELEITPDELVLGDIMVLRSGDQILVDGVVFGEGKVEVDESLLTGESDLIVKIQGDQVFSGTLCVSGMAYFEATQVGAQTVAYKLITGARSFRKVLTPLQREINFVIRALLLVSCFLWLLVGISFFSRTYSFADIVQHAAVVAGLVPAGLLIAITVAYGTGAVRMLGQDVLIQQANAVESLSHVDVLCVDKTGTLTANQINLQTIHPIGSSETQLREILGDYAHNTTAPNRTSEALAIGCPGRTHSVLAEIPFSSARKWSAIALANSDQNSSQNSSQTAYVLGAPEMLEGAIEYTAEMRSVLNEGTEQGLRVLIFGQAAGVDWMGEETLVLPLLKPLAILYFSDQLRTNVAETLSQFRTAGVELKVISGDNPDTVASLARQAGLAIDGELSVVSGLELAQMSDAEFHQAALSHTIFGRITPEQKAALVKALRDQKRYVAMIGDGVNDVLSLKQANLGIAMESGSKATRSVADIVLLKDSFASLPQALLEGQRIHNGIRDSLALFLVRIACVTMLIFAIAMVTDSFPLLNKQSAMLALYGVGLPTAAFPLWATPGVVQKRRSLMRSLLHFVVPATITMTIVALFIYLLFLMRAILDLPPGARLSSADYALPRTALVTVLVFCHLFLLPFLKPPTRFFTGGGEPICRDWRYTISAIVLAGLTLITLVVPVLRDFYELATLSGTDIAFLLAVALEWAFILRALWRSRFFDHFLGIDLG
jgi:cation-transporting P-type ATPase E